MTDTKSETPKLESYRNLARKVLLRSLSLLALFAAYQFMQNMTFQDWLSFNGMKNEGQFTADFYFSAVLVIVFMSVLAAPASPLIATGGCVMLATSFDRYSAQNTFNHYYGLHHAAASWLILANLDKLKMGLKRAFHSGNLHMAVAFSYLSWICLVEIYHVVFKQSVHPFFMKTWIHASLAIMLTIVLANTIVRKREIDFLAFTLSVPLCCRRFILNENITLNHDIPIYAVCSIPLVAFAITHGRLHKRIIASIILLATLYLIIETDNRGALVGVALAISGALIGASWKSIPAILFILPGLAILLKIAKPSYFSRFTDILTNGPAAQSFFSRFEIYSIALSLPPATYIFGVGLGRFGAEVLEKKPELGRINAHNSWISVLTELGVVGLLLYSLLICFGIHAAYRLARHKTKSLRYAGISCLSCIFGYCGCSLSIARDLFLPFFLIIGIVFSMTSLLTDNSQKELIAENEE